MDKSGQIREQLEKTLTLLQGLQGQRLAKGWIRSIREALGMSGRQLAERIQVKPSRIPEMEKAEAHGNITLKSLRRAAEAMDCDLVYGFVPRADLESSLRAQARIAAGKKLGVVSHTMRLEEQGLTDEGNTKQLSEMVEAWVRSPPRWLWDKA